MKKIFLVVIPILLALVVFWAIQFFFGKNENGKGALQVTANPESNVFLNGTFIGKTPLCKCEVQDMLGTGDYTIRITPKEGGYTSFEDKVTIGKSVLTVVDRTFGKGGSSEGSIISLVPIQDPKKAEILVVTFPDKAELQLNSIDQGETSKLMKDVTISDHEITVKKDGYKEKTVRIRTAPGYKLISTVFLGVSPETAKAPQTVLGDQKVATVSASPSAKQSTVIVLKTPTGFLRVRREPSLGSPEIGRVTPDEVFDLLEEKTGWYKIKLSSEAQGWVSAQYVQKQ